MNKLRRKLNRREAISLVEVLTSVIVAVIGVAGVLVLIPFAIRQASVGIDLDDSTTIAENGEALFKLAGYNRVGVGGDEALPWIDEDSGNLINVNDPSGLFWIDPLWAEAVGVPFGQMFFALPNTDKANLDDDFLQDGQNNFGNRPFQPQLLNLLNLANPVDATTGDFNALPLGVSARMFQGRDDLEFATKNNPVNGTPLDAFSPPRPYVDIDGAGNNLRRQSRGEISWSAITVPKRPTGQVNLIGGAGLGQRADGYDFFILAYKDRSFENPMTFQVRDPRYLYTALRETGTPPNPVMINGSGTIYLADAMDVRPDNWVMLVNYDTNGQAQVGFFQVLAADPQTGNAGDTSDDFTGLSISGADFAIGDPGVERSTTFVVLLTDVVNVYQRQLVLEPN